MRSEKQRQAYRANGPNPKDRQGRTHRLVATPPVTAFLRHPDLKLELGDEFLALSEKLFDEFQPRTPFEESLVEGMVAAQ